MTKIITKRVWFDWIAYHQGETDLDRYGWGHSKQAAITDLLRLDVEYQQEEDEDEVLVIVPGPNFPDWTKH